MLRTPASKKYLFKYKVCEKMSGRPVLATHRHTLYQQTPGPSGPSGSAGIAGELALKLKFGGGL